MSGVIKAASTDQYTQVKLWTSVDGFPKTDAAFNTSGLSIKYQIGNAAIQSVTVGGSPAPATMSAGGAHADWGIYHRGNGWYVIGLADAVVATAGNRVVVWIELTDCDSAPAEIYVSGYDGAVVAVGASTFDHTTDEVTTDSASRTASRADVSDLPTNAELATALGTADDAMLSALAAIDTLIDGIKAKTDNLPADPATETTLATIDGLIDALTVELAKVPRAAAGITAGAFDMTITGGQSAEVTYTEPV